VEVNLNIFHKKLFYRLLNAFCFDFLKLLFSRLFMPGFPGGAKKPFLFKEHYLHYLHVFRIFHPNFHRAYVDNVDEN